MRLRSQSLQVVDDYLLHRLVFKHRVERQYLNASLGIAIISRLVPRGSVLTLLCGEEVL